MFWYDPCESNPNLLELEKYEYKIVILTVG